jgi:hypothetical protein
MASRTLQGLCAAASFLLFAAADLLAQSAAERVIGADDHGAPVTVRHLEDLGRLARASGVPIGVEQLAGTAFSPLGEFIATGLTLRAALDEVQRRDSRYSWRDVNGVIVVRPNTEWDRAGHVLDSQVGPVRASRIAARHALRIACAAVGALNPKLGHDDTLVFDLDFPGGTLFELLNTLVQSHGRLSWRFQLKPTDRQFPISVILSGDGGQGCGAPGISVPVWSTGLAPPPPAPIELSGLLHDRPPEGPVEPAQGDELDSMVPSTPELKARGMFDSIVLSLADTVDVPFVFERGPLLQPIPGEGYSLNGLTLRAALDLLTAIDSRYSWRDVGGVIVIRPHISWGDGSHPLFRLAPALEAGDASLSQVMSAILRALGAGDTFVSLTDSRRFAVNVPEGSVLDQLAAIARAHGQVGWIFSAADPPEAQRGWTHHLQIRMLNGGTGLGVPLK